MKIELTEKEYTITRIAIIRLQEIYKKNLRLCKKIKNDEDAKLWNEKLEDIKEVKYKFNL